METTAEDLVLPWKVFPPRRTTVGLSVLRLATTRADVLTPYDAAAPRAAAVMHVTFVFH